MRHHTSNLSTFKELEQDLFKKPLGVYQSALVSNLKEIYLWLIVQRDIRI